MRVIKEALRTLPTPSLCHLEDVKQYRTRFVHAHHCCNPGFCYPNKRCTLYWNLLWNSPTSSLTGLDDVKVLDLRERRVRPCLLPRDQTTVSLVEELNISMTKRGRSEAQTKSRKSAHHFFAICRVV